MTTEETLPHDTISQLRLLLVQWISDHQLEELLDMKLQTL